MRILLLLAAACLISSCDYTTTKTSEPQADSKLESGEVVLVATAPDGTNLWAVRPGDKSVIYFSSSGTSTSHSESCGRRCTRQVPDVVPNAQN